MLHEQYTGFRQNGIKYDSVGKVNPLNDTRKEMPLKRDYFDRKDVFTLQITFLHFTFVKDSLT